MGTAEILEEIVKLPADQRLALVELTIRSLREGDKKNILIQGADALMNDYTLDRELTSFTTIDQDEFYEAR